MPGGIQALGSPAPCLTLLQVEGGGRTPRAALAAQGGEMPPDKPTICHSFWLQLKGEAK